MTPTRYAFAALWLTLVLVLGTAYFATQETGVFVLPFLKLLAPGASSAKLQATHLVLRKLTHLVEYAVLALLWFRALLLARGRTPNTAAWMALCVCLVCAVIDETHQATIPSRTGSVRDFAIDASGVACMLMLVRGRQKSRDRATPESRAVAEPAE